MTDVYTGSDTIEIDGNLINDCANGKVVEVRFPNNISNSEKGKDNNSMITYIANGDICEVTIRVLIGGRTDQYLNLRKAQLKKDSASFVGMKGKFVKRVGDGSGATKKITYNLKNGVFMKNVEAETDTDGDINQTVAVYQIRFTEGDRTITA